MSRKLKKTRKKMNPEAKALWVEKLRSGLYPQTRGQLRKKNSFCCLGVLCDLSSRHEEEKWKRIPFTGGDHMFQSMNGEIQKGVLPNDVMEKAGLSEIACEELIALNDAGGLNFKQIADVIEEEL